MNSTDCAILAIGLTLVVGLVISIWLTHSGKDEEHHHGPGCGCDNHRETIKIGGAASVEMSYPCSITHTYRTTDLAMAQKIYDACEIGAKAESECFSGYVSGREIDTSSKTKIVKITVSAFWESEWWDPQIDSKLDWTGDRLDDK